MYSEFVVYQRQDTYLVGVNCCPTVAVRSRLKKKTIPSPPTVATAPRLAPPVVAATRTERTEPVCGLWAAARRKLRDGEDFLFHVNKVHFAQVAIISIVRNGFGSNEFYPTWLRGLWRRCRVRPRRPPRRSRTPTRRRRGESRRRRSQSEASGHWGQSERVITI